MYMFKNKVLHLHTEKENKRGIKKKKQQQQKAIYSSLIILNCFPPSWMKKIALLRLS